MQRRVFASPAFVLALVVSALAAPGAQAPAPAAQTPAPPPVAQTAPPAPAPNAATPENASTFIGDWAITAEGPNGPATFALAVKTADGKVTAEISSDAQPLQAITDVTKDDTSLVLRYLFDYQGMAVPVVVTLTPSGEKVDAHLDFADGAYLMDGTAAKKKKKA